MRWLVFAVGLACWAGMGCAAGGPGDTCASAKDCGEELTCGVVSGTCVSPRVAEKQLADKACAAQAACAERGACKASEGQDACVAEADQDCEGSAVCRDLGRCAALGGRCWVAASSDDECAEPHGEKRVTPCGSGLCSVVEGVCQVADHEDCEKTVGCANEEACARVSASRCGQAPETCEYWVPQVARDRLLERALVRVAELECADALPALEARVETGKSRRAALRAIRAIGAPEASLGALKRALMTKDGASYAVEMIKEWKLKAAAGALAEALREPPGKSHAEMLEVLLTLDEPASHEHLLIALATSDLSAEGRSVNTVAIEALGALKSAEAVPALLQAAFMRHRGRRLYQVVRKAMAQIGPAAVPTLVRTLEGDNEALMTWAKGAGIAAWEILEGPELAQLATDTLDPRVAGPAIANMAAEIKQPPGLSPTEMERWRTAQINRLTTLMLTLGAIELDDEAREALAKLVADREADAANQRLKAASILAYEGSGDAQTRLLKLWLEDADFVERKLDIFRAPLIYPLAEAIDAEHLETFELLVTDASERVTQTLADERVKSYLRVLKRCKADADCYIGALSSSNKWEILKACLMLAREGVGEADKVSAALQARFASASRSDVDIRRFSLMAIARRGGPAAGKALLTWAERAEDPYWPLEAFSVGQALLRRAQE